MTIISINHQPTGGKEWTAEITGRHPKYGFSREFLPVIARNWSSTGKTGSTSFELSEGKVYEINEPYKGRRFVTVTDGKIQEIPIKKVMEIVNDMEKVLNGGDEMEKEYEDITLEVGIWYFDGTKEARKIKFQGRELKVDDRFYTHDWNDVGTDYHIYETADGKYILYWTNWSKRKDDIQTKDYAILYQFPLPNMTYIGTMFCDRSGSNVNVMRKQTGGWLAQSRHPLEIKRRNKDEMDKRKTAEFR